MSDQPVAAVYLCDPPEHHHWVHQLSLEGLWVGRCSMCPTLTVDLADLRAKVERLPERGIGDVIRKADVLALLDGAQ